MSGASAAAADGFGQHLILVPHEFTAGSQAMPAGHYRVTLIEGIPEHLQIRNVTLGATATVKVINRMAVGYPTDRGIRLVLDQISGHYYLSEVWIAGQDGFMIRRTPEEHTRKIIASIQ
jgi:hypothetical protein